MHPKAKERILNRLETSYCQERKSTINRVGAVQDVFVINYLLAGSRMIRSEGRDAVASVINEWAGFKM